MSSNEAMPDIRGRGLGRWPQSFRVKAGVMWFGLGILVTVSLAAVFVPMLWKYNSTDLVASPLLAPSSAHLFGTDTVGRDVFARAMEGGRYDLVIAAVSVTASAVIGSFVGMVAAYSGRWLEAVLMRLADALIAFPFVVLVLAVVLLFGNTGGWGPMPAGMPAVLLAVIVTDWAVYARLARGEALSLRQRDFIVAARISGLSYPRIITRHLLPNLIGVIGGYMVTDAVIVILTVAALPFLGAGIQPPTPEWGSIMVEGSVVVAQAWWIIVFPGLMLAIAAIGLTLLGDGLLTKYSDSR